MYNGLKNCKNNGLYNMNGTENGEEPFFGKNKTKNR